MKLPFFIISLLLSVSLYAVRAVEGLIPVRQPDGETLLIRIYGDESRHAVTTEDGYLLLSAPDGSYVYADVDSGGLPVSAEMRATDPERRTPEIQRRLQSIDKEAVVAAMERVVVRRDAPARKGPGLMDTRFPTTGKQRALVILVEYTDVSFSMTDPKDFFTRMLNEEGFSDYEGTGSARDYFLDNSCGVFDPSFDVYGPVRLEHEMRHYGANDRWGYDSNPQQMVIEACDALDDEVDFSLYDTNGDGIIDNVFVYYAGYGEADGGGSLSVWPHSSKLSLVFSQKYVYDGVVLDRYACTNELQYFQRQDEPDGIGTFCHEFSHVLGLPDLYATTTINLTTPGTWDLMDNGSYNNLSRTPPCLSSFERYALGWMEPQQLTDGLDCVLYPLSGANVALIYASESGNEYFLFENRQQQGWDAYLPGHGMLVWQIDYNRRQWENNTVNDNIWHQYVDLIEADGKSGNESRAGDPFPGATENRFFNRSSTPSFTFWDKTEVPIGLYNITESPLGNVSFSVRPFPYAGGDLEDGVTEISVDARDTVVYDLMGRRVKAPLAPGIYVIGGAKVVK